MSRTRAQRRYRRQGYTFEICYLKDDQSKQGRPKLIVIHKANPGWREYRTYLLPGEVIRPVAKHYIHNGRKP